MRSCSQSKYRKSSAESNHQVDGEWGVCSLYCRLGKTMSTPFRTDIYQDQTCLLSGNVNQQSGKGGYSKVICGRSGNRLVQRRTRFPPKALAKSSLRTKKEKVAVQVSFLPSTTKQQVSNKRDLQSSSSRRRGS